jgi:hypothetical protein
MLNITDLTILRVSRNLSLSEVDVIRIGDEDDDCVVNW